MGQLLGLRRGEVPRSRRSAKLKLLMTPDLTAGAVANVDIYGAVWRFIRAFHAALYGEFLAERTDRAIELPFVAVNKGDTLRLQQHLNVVDRLKRSRAAGRIDRVHANHGQVRYECVWGEYRGNWMCAFGLDICDWKDLGKSPNFPARGCAGCYTISALPQICSVWRAESLLVPNLDPLDPFGR